MISQFYNDEDGQTLVEYAMLISLLALVIIAAISLFGRKTADMWGNNAGGYPDNPKT